MSAPGARSWDSPKSGLELPSGCQLAHEDWAGGEQTHAAGTLAGSLVLPPSLRYAPWYLLTSPPAR